MRARQMDGILDAGSGPGHRNDHDALLPDGADQDRGAGRREESGGGPGLSGSLRGVVQADTTDVESGTTSTVHRSRGDSRIALPRRQRQRSSSKCCVEKLSTWPKSRCGSACQDTAPTGRLERLVSKTSRGDKTKVWSWTQWGCILLREFG